MRIESNKHKESGVNKKEHSNFRLEKNVFDSSSSKTADASKMPTSGAFEKILEEARHQAKSKDEFSKEDSTQLTAKSDKFEDEKELLKHEKKDELQDRSQNDDGQNDGENSGHFNGSSLLTGQKSDSENVPAARAILHVADLEKIISYIRTQNMQNGQEILIALKNSVLQGLEIKISLNKSGNLKAEFIVLNEQIRKQIKKREEELLKILKQRSSKFSEISIFLA